MKKITLSALALFLVVPLISQPFPDFSPIRTGIYTVDGSLYKGQLVGFEEDQFYLYLSLTPFPVDSLEAPLVLIPLEDVARIKVEGRMPPDWVSSPIIGGGLGWIAGTFVYLVNYEDGEFYIPHRALYPFLGALTATLFLRKKVDQEFRIKDDSASIKFYRKNWKRYVSRSHFSLKQIQALANSWKEVKANPQADIPLKFLTEMRRIPQWKRARHISRLRLRNNILTSFEDATYARYNLGIEWQFRRHWRAYLQFEKEDYSLEYETGTLIWDYFNQWHTGRYTDTRLGLIAIPFAVDRLFSHRVEAHLGGGFLLRRYGGTIYITTFQRGTNYFRREVSWSPGIFGLLGMDYYFNRRISLGFNFIFQKDRGVPILDEPIPAGDPSARLSNHLNYPINRLWVGLNLHLF